MASANMLDIAKLTGNDAVVGLIEEAFNAGYGSEMQRFPSRTINGTSFKTGKRTALPTVAFRNANEGVTASKSTFKQVTVECFIIDQQIRADKAVADAHEDGPEAWKAIEAAGVMQATLNLLGKQVWYGVGTGGDVKGFPGAIAAYDTTNMVVDAGGTTATTGSSVWGVKFGPQYCQYLFGRNTALSLGEWATQQVAQSDDATKLYTAYTNGLTGWAGLQIGHQYSLGRIKKLTEDSSKGLTDARLSALCEKFETHLGARPDALFMTARSRRQLKDSRTATTPNGTPAPTPTDYEGIPIIVTPNILNTEALTL